MNSLNEMNNETPGSLASLLARIDERTTALVKDLHELKANLETRYVTQDEFRPVRALIYGMVGIILTGVIGALVMFALKGGFK